TDRLQCLSGGAILQTTRQRLKPGNILTLQHGQLGDRVPPTLGTAALVDCPPRAHDRHTGNSGGAATGLTLGVGHRPVTDRLARHGSIPKRDVTKYRAHKPTHRPVLSTVRSRRRLNQSNRAAAVTLTITSMVAAAKRNAVAEATVPSKSLASRRLRPSQAKKRSTTQRRGCTAKPIWPPCLRTISTMMLVAFATRSAA